MNAKRTRFYQFVFRDVNAQLAKISRAREEAASDFLCECGRSDCVSLVKIELSDYEDIRRNEEFFIAAPGHCVEGVDRLVEIRDGFELVVQK